MSWFRLPLQLVDVGDGNDVLLCSVDAAEVGLITSLLNPFNCFIFTRKTRRGSHFHSTDTEGTRPRWRYRQDS